MLLDYVSHDIIILVKKRMLSYFLDIHELIYASISDSYEIIYRFHASISNSYENIQKFILSNIYMISYIIRIYKLYASIPISYENILKSMLSNISMLLHMIKI